jgi:hypothetical protein
LVATATVAVTVAAPAAIVTTCKNWTTSTTDHIGVVVVCRCVARLILTVTGDGDESNDDDDDDVDDDVDDD